MIASPTESFSRNMSNFPQVTTAFPFVGIEGNILPQIIKYTTAALALEEAGLLQGRGELIWVSHMLKVDAQQCECT